MNKSASELGKLKKGVKEKPSEKKRESSKINIKKAQDSRRESQLKKLNGENI